MPSSGQAEVLPGLTFPISLPACLSSSHWLTLTSQCLTAPSAVCQRGAVERRRLERTLKNSGGQASGGSYQGILRPPVHPSLLVISSYPKRTPQSRRHYLPVTDKVTGENL